MKTTLGAFNTANVIEKTVKLETDIKVKEKQKKAEDVLEETLSKNRAKSLQEMLDKRYDHVKNAYRDRETQAVVIRDKGNKLKTKHTDPKHAIAMVQLADSKGWDSIKVKGTTEFKRAVYAEATDRGLSVKGYKPTQNEQREARERIEKKQYKLDKADSVVTNKIAKPTVKAKDHEVVLMEHGQAPYKDNPKKQMSYYATVIDVGVERKIWGVGLSEALKNSGVVSGEKIVLSMKNREAVVVPGKGVKTRMEWDVKRNDDFVKAHTAAKVLIKESKIDDKNKDVLYKSLDKEMTKLQNENKIPKVRIYDTDPNSIKIKKTEIIKESQTRKELAVEQKIQQHQPKMKL